MNKVTLITIGTLKEDFFRDAFGEYEKRLGGLCQFHHINLKESKLPDNPNQAEIEKALQSEEKDILAVIPPKSYVITLCVEGTQFSSEQLAEKIGQAENEWGNVTLIIGSSYGLSPVVKEKSQLRLSVSKNTFPHQLMRVMLMEMLYRSFCILQGKRYHK